MVLFLGLGWVGFYGFAVCFGVGGRDSLGSLLDVLILVSVAGCFDCLFA